MVGTRSGFSMLEMLISLVIGGIAMYGATSMLSRISKSQADVAAYREIEDYLNHMTSILSVAANCNASFTGKTFNPTAASLSQQTISNVAIVTSGMPSTPLAEAGKKLGTPAVKMNELFIGNFVMTSANNYNADLIFRMQLPGNLEFTRKIALLFATQTLTPTSASIISCAASNPRTLASSSNTSNSLILEARNLPMQMVKPPRNAPYTVPEGKILMLPEQIMAISGKTSGCYVDVGSTSQTIIGMDGVPIFFSSGEVLKFRSDASRGNNCTTQPVAFLADSTQYPSIETKIFNVRTPVTYVVPTGKIFSLRSFYETGISYGRFCAINGIDPFNLNEAGSSGNGSAVFPWHFGSGETLVFTSLRSQQYPSVYCQFIGNLTNE